MKKFALTAIAATIFSINAFAADNPAANEDIDVSLNITDYIQIEGLENMDLDGDDGTHHFKEIEFSILSNRTSYDLAIYNSYNGVYPGTFTLYNTTDFPSQGVDSASLPMVVEYHNDDEVFEVTSALYQADLSIADKPLNASLKVKVKNSDIADVKAGSYKSTLNFMFTAK